MPLPLSRSPLAAAAGTAFLCAALATSACSRPEEPAAAAGSTAPAPRPSILLVTLDTTRDDAIDWTPGNAVTPNLARLGEEGLRFRRAYATAPMTLPAHASLLTGLYPAEHGIHENGRALAAKHRLLAEELSGRGYATGAVVSSWVLARQFGLARGFDRYDDALPAGAQERSAAATTERALAWLAAAPAGPLFLWVHYFDPHAPYEPPEPYRSRFAAAPYRGEVASVDAQLGRLLDAFARRAGAAPWYVAVAGDHGEGLGEHGEAQHGRLLYEGVMRVPLLLAGPGVAAGEVATPVSARRLFPTLLGWAGVEMPGALPAAAESGPVSGARTASDADREPGRAQSGRTQSGRAQSAPEPVLGEAMQPYLSYGWQPQVMAVLGPWKAIHAGRVELYDVEADPAEGRDRAGEVALDRALAAALRGYPLPGDPGDAAGTVDEETRRRLAALGYTASAEPPRRRPDAPRPADMTHLFADLDRAAGLFGAGRHAEAIPLLERVAARDPGNLMVTVQIAVAHSLAGHDREALAWFERARRIDPGSAELQHSLGQHHCQRGEWAAAEPLLVATIAREPRRLPALQCLARLRAAQGRAAEAAALFDRVAELEAAPLPALLSAGELHMAAGETGAAIAAFERARELAGDGFEHHLELGVLYLAARRLPAAAEALDRVPPGHPGHAMALFKRAQVSVLLGEADARERIARAEAVADETTRALIERERLFAGLR